VPVIPSCLLDPLWDQFAPLLPVHPAVVPTHPLGCHRRRIPDRVVFEHVIAALVHGSGYERIATPGCSDRTIRRRVHEWAAAGLTATLHALVLAQYDRLVGLELEHLSVDGCITKAPCGGEKAGRSPVDRGKQGLKRSTAVDGAGVPLHLVAAGANRHDAPLLEPTLAGLTKLGPLPAEVTTVTTHLDRAYDGNPSRAVLARLGLTGDIARKGVPAPLQAGKRWVVERTQSWMNGYGKLRRCTERTGAVVDFYLFLAAAFVTVRALIREARQRFRWDGRPTTRRLK
jgi:transposase